MSSSTPPPPVPPPPPSETSVSSDDASSEELALVLFNLHHNLLHRPTVELGSQSTPTEWTTATSTPNTPTTLATATPTSDSTNNNNNGANTSFPVKLYQMLQDATASTSSSSLTDGQNNIHNNFQDIVSWQEPDGTSFRVHQPQRFVDEIMPRYFKQTKFKSFQRQLNIYGFRRIHDGKHRGGYAHRAFVRGTNLWLLSEQVSRLNRGGGTVTTLAGVSSSSAAAAASLAAGATGLLRISGGHDGGHGWAGKGTDNEMMDGSGVGGGAGINNGTAAKYPFQTSVSSLYGSTAGSTTAVAATSFGDITRYSSPVDCLTPAGANGTTAWTVASSPSSTPHHPLVPTTPLATAFPSTRFGPINHDHYHHADTTTTRNTRVMPTMTSPSPLFLPPPSSLLHVFPFKLYKMLQETADDPIIADTVVGWVHDGRAFQVHSTTEFVTKVMPMYFDQTKYESFRRQLNLYGFSRATIRRGSASGKAALHNNNSNSSGSGMSVHPKKGGAVYSHKYFQRHRPEEVRFVTRQHTSVPPTGPSDTILPQPREGEESVLFMVPPPESLPTLGTAATASTTTATPSDVAAGTSSTLAITTTPLVWSSTKTTKKITSPSASASASRPTLQELLPRPMELGDGGRKSQHRRAVSD